MRSRAAFVYHWSSVDRIGRTVVVLTALPYSTDGPDRPHSIILASCKPGCKPGFGPGFQPGFRQVRAGLRHAFDTLSTFFVENLVPNLLYQSRHVEIDAAGSQQVRWFVRVLD